MVPSLSMVLPVYNAEATLSGNVGRLLELLPDLAERFEVLVVDDGSSDHTADIARELATRFPQLQLVRHGQRRGMGAAVQTGLDKSRGDYVLIQHEHEPLSPQDVRRLWEMRHDEDLVVARTPARATTIEPGSGLLSRLLNWGRNLPTNLPPSPAGGTQLIRRRALEELTSNPVEAGQLRFATAHGAEKIARVPPSRFRLPGGTKSGSATRTN